MILKYIAFCRKTLVGLRIVKYVSDSLVLHMHKSDGGVDASSFPFLAPPIPSGPESETFSKRKSILEERTEKEAGGATDRLKLEGRFFGHLAAGRFSLPPGQNSAMIYRDPSID